MNYKQNERYFAKESFGSAIALILIGGLAALVGFGAMDGSLTSSGTLIFVIGLAGIAGGILFIRAKIKSRVTDAEIDASVADYATKIRAVAMGKLNVDPAEVEFVEPLFVTGYDYTDATLFKRGSDGKFRTNIAEAVVIFFSEDVLHAYKEQFSLTDPSYTTNETHTYFYKDVVSISTSTGKVDSVVGKITYDEFRLTTSGGTNIGCSILNQSLSERSIQGAKTLVMERKRA